MWHKPCRTFHPWCPCIKTSCLLSYWLHIYFTPPLDIDCHIGCIFTSHRPWILIAILVAHLPHTAPGYWLPYWFHVYLTSPLDIDCHFGYTYMSVIQVCAALPDCHWLSLRLAWNSGMLLTQALLLNGTRRLDHCDVKASLVAREQRSWHHKPNVIYSN